MPLADRIVLRSSPTEDTTPDMGMLLGHALAMDYKRIVVARDQMRSSSMMKEALVAGILSSGADVLDIGVASGPAAALAATKGDCAVYVTEYRGYGMISGYILLNRDGSLFRKEQIRHLEKIFVDPPELPPSGKLGHVIDLLGAVDEYNARLTSAVSGKSECAIILDCGCGPVSASAPVILNGDLETSMHWLTSRVDAGVSTSAFNLSIILTPLIVLLTVVMGFKVARDGVQDFRTLSLLMLLPVAIMFILPGNVQYYLFLLPFMVFAFTKEMYIPYVSMSLLAVMSLLVVINLCSLIYVDSGLPGAGIIDGIADVLDVFEGHSISYEFLKSITGALVAIATAYILLKPRFSNEAHRCHSDCSSRRRHARRHGPVLWSEHIQMRPGRLGR